MVRSDWPFQKVTLAPVGGVGGQALQDSGKWENSGEDSRPHRDA